MGIAHLARKMPETWQVACGGTCLAILVIVSIILIAVSFSTLEPNEVGLAYDNNYKVVDNETLYTNGRWFLGLGRSFIKFPTNLQETDLAFTARSQDGAQVSLQVSFQWAVDPTIASVFNLYSKFDDTYPQAIEKIAKDDVRNAAARFDSFEFFFNRSMIVTAMAVELSDTLEGIGALVSGFQLLNFDVPPAFSRSITETEETRQRIAQVEEEKLKANITAESQIVNAMEDAQIVRVAAQADAAAFLQEKQAERESIIATIDAEAAAYKQMIADLNLTGDELLALIWLSSIQNTAAPQTHAVRVPETIFETA